MKLSTFNYIGDYWALGFELSFRRGALRVGAFPAGKCKGWFKVNRAESYRNAPPGSWHVRLWRFAVAWRVAS